jgi:site-specific DNA-methyltransferase (cytosine-N4-specific)
VNLYYSDDAVTLWLGDSLTVLRALPAGSVDCCVTSPPYFGLRDYGVDGQYGLEASPAEYVETMQALFAEVRRVLTDDGTLWLNLGDSYSTRGGNMSAGVNGKDYGKTYADLRTRVGDKSGLPDKNLLGIPWRTAFALQDDGWILRNGIIWNKPNAMPESVTDRLSTRYEHVFMFSKKRSYWFDLDPIREPLAYPGDLRHLRGQLAPAGQARLDPRTRTSGNGETRNPGDVWTIPTQPFAAAHFAVMPSALAERCIQAGCKPGGTVLDPFSGSGTTGLAAAKHGRRYIGIDLNREYLDLSLRTRLAQTSLLDIDNAPERTA